MQLKLEHPMRLIVQPGNYLRDLRNRLGVTTREVEELSHKIAQDRNNEEFSISNAWLTQLENKNSVPSIYKLFSLSVIYRAKFVDLLSIFGVELEDSVRYHSSLPLNNTHLASIEVADRDRAVRFPVRFDRGFRVETTSLISRMVEVWGEVPIALIEKLDVRNCQYGFIGMDDRTMDPLLRPGSFVQIDSHRKHVASTGWRTELDRPIYFVELREGYACSWCEMRGSNLTLIPHPLSGCATRQFAHPGEAEIIGQVTAVAMRLVSAGNGHLDGPPKLPVRS
jgi:transcriptional regulator with XRE-family HTH domain